MSDTSRSLEIATRICSGESAWLSLAESHQRVHALRSWTQAQQRVVASLFGRVWSGWGQQWGVLLSTQDEHAVGVTPLPCATAQTSGPMSAFDNAPEWALAPTGQAQSTGTTPWWAYCPKVAAPGSNFSKQHPASADPASSSQVVHALEFVLFGSAQQTNRPVLDEPGLATHLAQAAWLDWWQQVSDTVQAGAATDSWPPKPWSGALQINVPWGTGWLAIGLGAAQVQQLLEHHAPQSLRAPESPTKLQAQADSPRAPVQVDLLQAMATHVLQLRAELNEVELSLGQLQGLRVGDVVPLTHHLETPANIASQDGRTICLGWLGQQSGHVAVELAADNVPPATPAGQTSGLGNGSRSALKQAFE